MPPHKTKPKTELTVLGYVINNPFFRVVFNIFPNLIIIVLVANYMVVISLLPNIFAVFFVAKPFKCAYKTCNG